MTITKEDLVLTHYNWVEKEDESRYDLNPTRKTFSRDNGFQVLWVANWYADHSAAFQKNDLSTLETMISDELPFSKLSEKSVCEWLIKTWRTDSVNMK